MIPTIIQGVAMAFFFIPLTTITLSGLPPDKIPAASGLTNFARITGLVRDLALRVANLDHRPVVDKPKPTDPNAPCQQ